MSCLFTPKSNLLFLIEYLQPFVMMTQSPHHTHRHIYGLLKLRSGKDQAADLHQIGGLRGIFGYWAALYAPFSRILVSIPLLISLSGELRLNPNLVLNLRDDMAFHLLLYMGGWGLGRTSKAVIKLFAQSYISDPLGGEYPSAYQLARMQYDKN